MKELFIRDKLEEYLSESKYINWKDNSILSKTEVWYIGDQYQCNIVGASAAGLFPVWYIGTIDMKYEPKEDILTIENWKDLLDLL